MTATLPVGVLFFGPIGMTEMLILLAIVLIIFGASKLPQLGAGLGAGIRNFRKSVRSIGEVDESEETSKSASDKS